MQGVFQIKDGPKRSALENLKTAGAQQADKLKCRADGVSSRVAVQDEVSHQCLWLARLEFLRSAVSRKLPPRSGPWRNPIRSRRETASFR